jgi:hypothetical protein
VSVQPRFRIINMRRRPTRHLRKRACSLTALVEAFRHENWGNGLPWPEETYQKLRPLLTLEGLTLNVLQIDTKAHGNRAPAVSPSSCNAPLYSVLEDLRPITFDFPTLWKPFSQQQCA